MYDKFESKPTCEWTFAQEIDGKTNRSTQKEKKKPEISSPENAITH